MGYTRVDPKEFFDKNEAAHWCKSNGEPTRNWKQTIVVWENNQKKWDAEKEALMSPEERERKKEIENRKKIAKEQQPFYDKLNELFKIYLEHYGADALDTNGETDVEKTENFWRMARADEDFKLCDLAIPGTSWWEPVTHNLESCKKLYGAYARVLKKHQPQSLEKVELIEELI